MEDEDNPKQDGELMGHMEHLEIASASYAWEGEDEYDNEDKRERVTCDVGTPSDPANTRAECEQVLHQRVVGGTTGETNIILQVTNDVHWRQQNDDVANQLMQINVLVNQDEGKGQIGAPDEGEAFAEH